MFSRKIRHVAVSIRWISIRLTPIKISKVYGIGLQRYNDNNNNNNTDVYF